MLAVGPHVEHRVLGEEPDELLELGRVVVPRVLRLELKDLDPVHCFLRLHCDAPHDRWYGTWCGLASAPITRRTRRSCARTATEPRRGRTGPARSPARQSASDAGPTGTPRCSTARSRAWPARSSGPRCRTRRP